MKMEVAKVRKRLADLLYMCLTSGELLFWLFICPGIFLVSLHLNCLWLNNQSLLPCYIKDIYICIHICIYIYIYVYIYVYIYCVYVKAYIN